MQITISKQTAKNIDKAIWLLIQTCNKNRPAGKFEPNDKIMGDMKVTIDDLHNLSKAGDQINKKLSTKNKRK